MSRTTKTITGSKAKQAIYRGVNAIYGVVRGTFGPEGKNALLFRTMNRGERITNDGVTVAECQIPKNQFIRMAAETFKESCKKTNEKVGDGTTCTTILGGKLFNDVYALMEKSSSSIGGGSKMGVMTLKKKILDSAEKVKKEINKQSKKIKTLEDLEKVAIISVEDEELGKLVAKMAWEVGVDGFIDVVEGYKGKIETEVVKGMRFNAKIAGKGFLNRPEKFEMVAEDSAVLLTNYKLDNTTQVANMLNDSVVSKFPKIAILAPEFSEDVLAQLYRATYTLVNDGKGGMIKTKGKYTILPVKIPSLRTPQMEDLAIYFGARFIDKGKGDSLNSFTEKDLGFVEKLVVKDSEIKEDAIAQGGGGTTDLVISDAKKDDEGVNVETKTRVQERLDILKQQLEETKQPQFKKLLERRIASMASAVGIIRVGDTTQASSLYRKLKIEDAVYACKAALRGGYVKGGGLCLKEISEKLPEDDILKPVLLAPYEQIQNSVEGGMKIGENVIDPAEAIYYAVEHATQVVANLITVDSITCETEDPVFGEGEFEIAKALQQMVITQKIKEGQLKAGQEEAYMDSLGGLNDDEFVTVNQD